MSNYIIPEGWYRMTEKWKEGDTVNVLYKNGTIDWAVIDHAYSPTSDVVAWQYVVPLSKKQRRYHVINDGINGWSVYDAEFKDFPALMCKDDTTAQAIADYFESIFND